MDNVSAYILWKREKIPNLFKWRQRACHEKFARLYFHLFICVYRIVYIIECVGEMPKGCKIPSWKINEGRRCGKINNVHPFCSLVRTSFACICLIAGANHAWLHLFIHYYWAKGLTIHYLWLVPIGICAIMVSIHYFDNRKVLFSEDDPNWHNANQNLTKFGFYSTKCPLACMPHFV